MAFDRQTDLTKSMGRPKAEQSFAALQFMAIGAFVAGAIGWLLGGVQFFLLGLGGYLLFRTILVWVALVGRRRYEIYRSRIWKDWLGAIGTTAILLAFVWFVLLYHYEIGKLLE